MKSINWLDKFIEILVVIIGITIAFWLNNWNQERNDRSLEKKYMESLVYDINSDIEELTTMVDTFTYFNKLNAELVNGLTNKSLKKDSLPLYIFCMISVSEFHPQDNTYETLKSSGNFNLLKTFELEKEITVLYNEYYKQIDFIDEIHQNNVMNDLNLYISERVSFFGNNDSSNMDFAYTTYFINKAFTMQYLMISKKGIYEESLKQSIKVRDLLNSQLEK